MIATTKRCPECGLPPNDWLKARHVAAKFDVCRTTVPRMIKDGRLAGKKFGHVWRVLHRGVDADGIPGLHEFLKIEDA